MASTFPTTHADDSEERLGASRARADPNIFVNRGTHHGQNPIGNVGHVMHGYDVICDVR